MNSQTKNLQKIPQYINIGGKINGDFEWKRLGGSPASTKGQGYKLVVIWNTNTGRCYGGNLDETYMPNDRKTISGSFNKSTGDLRLVETYYRDGKFLSTNDINGVIKKGKIIGKGKVKNSTTEYYVGDWFNFDCKVTFKDASNELLMEMKKESSYQGD